MAAQNAPDTPTGPCAISWIDNNQLQSITWRLISDDALSANLVQNGDEIRLGSSNLPELMDVDQDGWQDIVTFTPAGMVNGTFDVFFYHPETREFRPSRPLFGHTLERDHDGYVVATSRDGPGQRLRFFAVEDRDFTLQFEIDPHVLAAAPQGTRFDCHISTVIGDDGAEPLPDNPALFAYYCDTEPQAERETRNIELIERPAMTDRVPAGTVFYCRLEGNGDAVTISAIPGGLRYAYGPPLKDNPDLVLEHRMDQIDILPENGAGPSRFGQITFTNGPYDYVASYGYELFDSSGELLPSLPDIPRGNPTFHRSLTVYKDGNIANPVFSKTCLPEHSYDAIWMLEPQ